MSFGTGIPAVELRAARTDELRNENARQAEEQTLRRQREQEEQDMRARQLRERAFAGDDEALRELFALNPDMGNQVFESMGAQDQASREEAARDAAAIRALPFEQRRPAILERAARLEAQGRDASDTLSLLEMDEQNQNMSLRTIEMAALSARDRLITDRSGGLPADVRGHTAQVNELTELEAIPENQRTPAQKTRIQALRVELGLDPRAGTTSSLERQATDETLGDAVTNLETERGEAVRFAELTGSARAQAITNATAEIQRLDADIRTLDEGIAALDAGASTGAIESRFAPTLRESTVLLENVQARLGLNVIGATTFGSLSEEELRFALASAMPTGLQPDALREWLEKRRRGQEGLREWFIEQIEFLNNGGTVAEFMLSKEDSGEPGRVGRFEVTVIPDADL